MPMAFSAALRQDDAGDFQGYKNNVEHGRSQPGAADINAAGEPSTLDKQNFNGVRETHIILSFV